MSRVLGVHTHTIHLLINFRAVFPLVSIGCETNSRFAENRNDRASPPPAKVYSM